MIKNASLEISDIAQQRINQIISQGGKEVESILPKILRGAIEDIRNTFSDAGEFWKTTTLKTKKQDIMLHKYLTSLIVFYMKSNTKSLYIFKLQIYY